MSTPDNQPSDESAGPINWETAFASVQDDQELLRDVAEAFFEECPDLVSRLQTAVEEKDPNGLQRAAHTLKSSLQTFGADQAYEFARRLEEMGRESQINDAAEVFDALQTEVEQVIEQLSAFVAKR